MERGHLAEVAEGDPLEEVTWVETEMLRERDTRKAREMALPAGGTAEAMALW